MTNTGHDISLIVPMEHEELWDAVYSNQRRINDGLSSLRRDIDGLLARIAEVEAENAMLKDKLNEHTDWRKEVRRRVQEWPGFDPTRHWYVIATGGGDGWRVIGTLTEAIINDLCIALLECDVDQVDQVDSLSAIVEELPGSWIQSAVVHSNFGDPPDVESDMVLLHAELDVSTGEWRTFGAPKPL